MRLVADEDSETVADMAVDTIEAIPRHGSVAIDDLARAGKGDVLIAMTCKPFRTEVVEAVEIARAQGEAATKTAMAR